MRSALPVAVSDEWDAEAWAVARVHAAAAPALVLRSDGTVVAENVHASALCELGIPTALRVLAANTSLLYRAQVARLSIPTAAQGMRRFDLTLVPLPEARVLVVGHETTLETNMIAALTASRELFRDLALCSTDFAFETDASGVFTWVSPGGALGLSASELHGSRAHDAFGNVEGIEQFSAREPAKACEIWCRSKTGAEVCIVLTVVPFADAHGRWCGTRGVVRDVTALRLHEREAARAKRREELINAVVGAMRAQIEPRRMMLAAADALRAATESARVEIRPRGKDLFTSVGVAVGAECGLIASTSYQGATNGTVSLARDAGEAYGEEEQALLDAVVPHLGIAIALAESLSAMAVQTQTDPLTGLLNRRGFNSEATKRLGAFARAGKSGALLLVDCDAFKAINDRFGHSTGDDVLAAIGRLLTGGAHASDLAARVGGDEFALLTEEATRQGVTAKAEWVRDRFGTLRAELGLKVDVTPSVGVAFVEPESGEPLEELMARADCALNTAKREGRNRVAVAERSEKVTTC